MKILTIIIERFSYTARTSVGDMFFLYDKEYVTPIPRNIRERFGYTLEDTVRPENIKVYGETGIPGGVRCKVRLYESDHHGKTIIFYTEEDGVTLKWKELSWTYVLAHGGNTHIDTMACVLVAKNKISNDMIQGSLKDELRIFIENKIKEGYTIEAEFINLTQLS